MRGEDRVLGVRRAEGGEGKEKKRNAYPPRSHECITFCTRFFTFALVAYNISLPNRFSVLKRRLKFPLTDAFK